jgi:hypothetical protein
MWQRILSEPTMLMELVRQLVMGAGLFGLVAVTPEQDRWIAQVVSLLLAIANRAMVSPRVP